jgi:hypothetical protein
MPRKPAPDPDVMLLLFVKRAPDLRAAGITSVSLDGFTVTLGPPDPVHTAPEPPEGDAPPPPPEPSDNPMQDAATYGGGRVPGFQKPKKE